MRQARRDALWEMALLDTGSPGANNYKVTGRNSLVKDVLDEIFVNRPEGPKTEARHPG